MTKLDNLIRLNQLAEQIHKQGKKVAVLLEGRDGAGKSGTIRDFTQYLPPYTYSVVPSFMPTKKQMSCWLKSWELLIQLSTRKLTRFQFGIEPPKTKRLRQN